MNKNIHKKSGNFSIIATTEMKHSSMVLYLAVTMVNHMKQ